MMQTDLPKSYDAKTVEAKWYQFWETAEFFQADPESTKPPYCVSIPPPNVTGALHMGHALVNTLQDVLIRWKRMSGFEALWVPGTDHAGIATQTVVERHLMKTRGKKRKDFSREEFLKYVWEWKEKNEGRIIDQLKRLGCSCDWTRLRFTMDEGNNRAVRKVFKMLYDAKLIYRGDYLVNWDPVTQTALADDEVEYEERQSSLWYFKYPLADGTAEVQIATTRPETMLGDTAVAVAASDQRYASLIGKSIALPLMDRQIPIIADHRVDPEFGTGAVKITPAHDPNDYQIGLTHQLPLINIMTPDGKINERGGEFAGMSMTEAREAVVKEMDTLGLLAKVEPHTHRVGVSYRSKATIEPYLSKQWFVKMEGFAKDLRNAVETSSVKLIPKNWETTYYHWIDNLRDWCISRQLWWGHRIPIWYHQKDKERIICYDGQGEPKEVQQAKEEWKQDEDVLDTWFSSALWPFSILGWPGETQELKKFYPNSVLVTGHDILFFWVARMILMGDYVMGHPPFPETFLHGLIFAKSYWRVAADGGAVYVDDQERMSFDLGKPTPKGVLSKWEKMSKTKGNIIDPLEISDQYGTDAMRMALCASASHAREIDLDRRKFEEFKNFSNKVWNGARFVLMNIETLTKEELILGVDQQRLSLEDRWILSELNRTVSGVNEKLQTYQFDQAAMEAYEFFWNKFCAYYVELAKPVLFQKVGTFEEFKNKQKLLVILLCQCMRLLHPMAPFITEELFQRLKEHFGDLSMVSGDLGIDPYTKETLTALQSKACMVAPFPTLLPGATVDESINETFDLMGNIVYAIRNIRGEMKIPPSLATDIHLIIPKKDPRFSVIDNNQHIITALVNTSALFVESGDDDKLGFACTAVVESCMVKIPLPKELIDKEKKRLFREKERLASLLENLKKQLSNQDFIQKAPKELVEKKQSLHQQTESELEEISRKLDSLTVG